MYTLLTEQVSIDGFFKIINTHKFKDESEFDNYLLEFIEKVKKDTENRICEENNMLEKRKECQKIMDFERDFYETMESIDEIILHRKEYLDKIAEKNKYRGKYVSKNEKGSTRYIEIK
jgi:hypothetical protein